MATTYAINNDNTVSLEDATKYWWLRSPGDSTNYAAFVSNVGDVTSNGEHVSFPTFGVRPAMWVKY